MQTRGAARSSHVDLDAYCPVQTQADPPPLKWSDLRYVFDIQEDCNDTSLKRLRVVGGQYFACRKSAFASATDQEWLDVTGRRWSVLMRLNVNYVTQALRGTCYIFNA